MGPEDSDRRSDRRSTCDRHGHVGDHRNHPKSSTKRHQATKAPHTVTGIKFISFCTNHLSCFRSRWRLQIQEKNDLLSSTATGYSFQWSDRLDMNDEDPKLVLRTTGSISNAGI